MKNQRKRISRKKPELLLDDITNSDDPEIKQYMLMAFSEERRNIGVKNIYGPAHQLKEEIKRADERALIRLAWKFKHLLSPQMQKILEAQHPRPGTI